MRVDEIMSIQGNAPVGSDLFVNDCGDAQCHGYEGTVGPAPSLPLHVPNLSNDELGCLLLTGSGEMPSHEEQSDQELADLIAYVRETFG